MIIIIAIAAGGEGFVRTYHRRDGAVNLHGTGLKTRERGAQ